MHTLRTSSAIQLMAFVVLLCLASSVFANGDKRAGTAAAPELLIPVDARGAALGGASIATTAGITALSWNPAGLARGSHDAALLFATMSYLADIRISYAAVSARFAGLGSVAANMKVLTANEVEITTETQPDGTGGTFAPTFVVAGLSFARQVGTRVAVGGTVNYVANRFDQVGASALAFNFGLQYADFGAIQGLDFGVSIKNLGTPMRFDGSGLRRRGQTENLRRPSSTYKIEASSADLPSTFELGFGYRYRPRPADRLQLHTMFQRNNFDLDEIKMGVEYGFGDFLTLRTGFDVAPGGRDNDLFGSSFGLGLELDVGGLEDVDVDYAFTDVKFFDSLHTVSVAVGF